MAHFTWILVTYRENKSINDGERQCICQRRECDYKKGIDRISCVVLGWMYMY